MYKVNKPIRIVQQNEDVFLLSIPKNGLRIEINKNVLELINLMQSKDIIDNTIIDEYTRMSQIVNKEDYIKLFDDMLEIGVLVAK